jgi:hypothetical protein
LSERIHSFREQAVLDAVELVADVVDCVAGCRLCCLDAAPAVLNPKGSPGEHSNIGGGRHCHVEHNRILATTVLTACERSRRSSTAVSNAPPGEEAAEIAG